MKKIAVVIFSFLLVLIAGCGSNQLQVKLSTPKTFTTGKTFPMQFKIEDPKKTPILGAKVSASLNMKNMDHGTIPVSVEEIGEGKYIGLANLPMNGDWVVNITVKHKGKKVEDEKEFSVEVATKINAHKVSKNVSLPTFDLIDQNGQPFSQKELLGKTVALTFTYVNCVDPNACPVLLGNFSKLQQDLKANNISTNDLELVSVSLDPDTDTPELLKEHAAKMNMDTSYFKMLTGKSVEIQKLAAVLGEHYEKKGTEVLHDNKTFIFDPNGKLTHEFSGSFIDREELFQLMSGR